MQQLDFKANFNVSVVERFESATAPPTKGAFRSRYATITFLNMTFAFFLCRNAISLGTKLLLLISFLLAVRSSDETGTETEAGNEEG